MLRLQWTIYRWEWSEHTDSCEPRSPEFSSFRLRPYYSYRGGGFCLISETKRFRTLGVQGSSDYEPPLLWLRVPGGMGGGSLDAELTIPTMNDSFRPLNDREWGNEWTSPGQT